MDTQYFCFFIFKKRFKKKFQNVLILAVQKTLIVTWQSRKLFSMPNCYTVYELIIFAVCFFVCGNAVIFTLLLLICCKFDNGQQF